MAERGTPTEIHYLLEQNLQERYQSILAGHYSISEKIYVETLGLPPSTCHTEDDICQVSRNLNELPG